MIKRAKTLRDVSLKIMIGVTLMVPTICAMSSSASAFGDNNGRSVGRHRTNVGMSRHHGGFNNDRNREGRYNGNDRGYGDGYGNGNGYGNDGNGRGGLLGGLLGTN